MSRFTDSDPLITEPGPLRYTEIPASDVLKNAGDAYPALRRRYWKNLLVLSFSVCTVFISFTALQSLESSINSAAGLGVMSLCTVYATLAVGCLFSPLVVDRIGAKSSILIMFCTQIIFAGANFYPRYWTLVPASGFVGLTSAFFWTGVGTYILQAATGYAALVGRSVDKILNTFSGVYVGIWQSSQVVGNLVSSLVLHKNSTANEVPIGVKRGWFQLEAGNHSEKLTCGADFCNFGKNDSHKVTNSTSPPQDILFILLGAYLGCCVLGTLLALFGMDKKPGGQGVNVLRDRPREEVSSWSKVLATVKQHKERRIQLLIPLFMYAGLSQGFMFSDYTQAFVGCVLGIDEIGLTMVTFGGIDAISSFGVGIISNSFRRMPIYLIAAIINTSMLLMMIMWNPVHWSRAIFYVVPGLWGVADAIWQTKTAAMLGIIFKESMESTWACYLLWQAVGTALGFVGSRFLCMGIKMYVILAMLAVAFVLYTIMEFVQKTIRPQLPDLSDSTIIIN